MDETGERMSAPRRFRVLGVSGSGKSRFAARLAETLGLPRLELDAVFWDADWTKRPLDEAHAIVDGFVAARGDGWVIDGDWGSSLHGRLEPGTPGGPDLLVWLDHSRARVMARSIRRAMRRGLLREELWHGNRERVSSWFRWNPDENILRWAWTQHPRKRATMLARIDAGEPIVRLRGQRAVDAWLARLPDPTPGKPEARDIRQ